MPCKIMIVLLCGMRLPLLSIMREPLDSAVPVHCNAQMRKFFIVTSCARKYASRHTRQRLDDTDAPARRTMPHAKCSTHIWEMGELVKGEMVGGGGGLKRSRARNTIYLSVRVALERHMRSGAVLRRANSFIYNIF